MRESLACWDLELVVDMVRYLGRIVVHKVADTVVRNPPQLSPVSKRAYRWFLARREYPAPAEAEDVSELVS